MANANAPVVSTWLSTANQSAPTNYRVITTADWAALQSDATIQNLTIYMMPGVYNSMPSLSRRFVRYRPYGNAYSVTIQPNLVTNNDANYYYGLDASGITLEGIRIYSAMTSRDGTTNTSSPPFGVDASTLLFNAINCSLKNCIISDIYQFGAFHIDGSNLQDCLFYNIGIDEPSLGLLGQAVYWSNAPGAPIETMRNIAFAQTFGFATQWYNAGGNQQGLNATNFLGISCDHVIGCENGSYVDNVTLTNSAFITGTMDFGYLSTDKRTGVLTGNYALTTPTHLSGWSNLTNSGNTFGSDGEYTFVYGCNSYRAVAHLGWRSASAASSITFSMSGLGMIQGATYRLRNAQNPFNETPVAANNIIDFVYGVTPNYGGGTLTVPTGSRSCATPRGGVGTHHPSLPNLNINNNGGIWLLERLVS